MGCSMSALTNDIRAEVIDVLTSSLTGFTVGASASTNVFEYEVEPGLFLGVAPRTDEDDTIATLYVYVADLARYSDEETSLEHHPTIKNLLHDIDELIDDAFEDTDVDTDTFPATLDHIAEEGTPGRYYAMDLPRETAAA